MALTDVTVTISILTPTPMLSGFGKPLIIGASTAGKDYKNYSNLEAVKVDYVASTEEYKAAAAIFSGKNAPSEIAIASRKTGATPVLLPDFMDTLLLKDWHFAVTTSTVVDDITTIGDKIEADKSGRQFLFRSSSKTDLATIKAKNYSRTAGAYHSATAEIAKYPEAVWIGCVGSLPVGSVTWKGWTLPGIVPMEIDATELKSIHDLGANTYVTKAGTSVTSEGKAVNGEYIDIIHSRDYVVSSIQYAVQDLFNKAQLANSKISFDNTGIAQIESAVRTVLQRAYNNGMIATDDDGVPKFTTTFAPRSSVDPALIQQRKYTDGKFSFVPAGAIHETTINGVIQFS